MALSIGFITVSALTTSAGGVTRVNENDGNTRSLCLVPNKTRQLKERPIAHLPTHFPIEAEAAFSNTRQVFEAQCLAGKKCRLHKLFRDNVIDMPAVTRGFQAHLFESAPRPFRSRFLQAAAMIASAAAHSLDRFARIRMAFAVGGNLNDAEVNTQNTIRLNQRRVRNADRSHQVEVAIDKGQITFALLKSKKAALILTANKRQFQATCHRPDAHLPFVRVPSQDTGIVGNRAQWLKCSLGALVQFVGVSDLADSTNNDLRGQPRFGALSRVLALVQRVLPKGLVLPSPCAETIANGVCRLHRLLQSIRLFGRYEQFDLGYKFHYTDIIPAITQGIIRVEYKEVYYGTTRKKIYC